jgi:hypothetical protein
MHMRDEYRSYVEETNFELEDDLSDDDGTSASVTFLNTPFACTRLTR